MENNMFNPYENDKVFVIAEIGINHNGDMKITKQLIDQAAEAGCDAVKFQKRTLDVVYTQEYLDGPRESPWGTTQRDQKMGLEFGKKEYDEINSYCKKKGILWSASAWDNESQLFLRNYDLSFNKVASAMLTNESLLETIAEEKKHTFISTGMSTYEDIDKAVEIFTKQNCPFSLMHCVSTYPCKDTDCKLRMIATLTRKYPNTPVGYSGHETGVFPTLLAVTAGAKCVERHLTLDKTMYGSDQSASIEFSEFKEIVDTIRDLKDIIGDGVKTVSAEEQKIADKLRYF